MKKKKKLLRTLANQNISLNVYEEEYEQFKNATEFWQCNQPLSLSKVELFSHLPGKFEWATHSTRCNNAKQLNFVQLVFQNLSGYHSHMFSQEKIGERKTQRAKFFVAPISSENFISITDGCLLFLNLTRFFQACLDYLSINP